MVLYCVDHLSDGWDEAQEVTTMPITLIAYRLLQLSPYVPLYPSSLMFSMCFPFNKGFVMQSASISLVGQ
jgi:hypothetical protein